MLQFTYKSHLVSFESNGELCVTRMPMAATIRVMVNPDISVADFTKRLNTIAGLDTHLYIMAAEAAKRSGHEGELEE